MKNTLGAAREDVASTRHHQIPRSMRSCGEKQSESQCFESCEERKTNLESVVETGNTLQHDWVKQDSMAVGTPTHSPLFNATVRLRMVGEGVDKIIHETAGIELKIEIGVTWLEFSNGVRLLPASSTRNEGTSYHAIGHILAPGHKVVQGLRTGILYKREVENLPTERSFVPFSVRAHPRYPVLLEVSVRRAMGGEMRRLPRRAMSI